jgi:hypothetical protein
VDSSLLEEWEALRGGADEKPPPKLTTNRRALTVLVRNALFQRVELVARRAWSELGVLDGEAGWDAACWADAMAPYFAEYASVGIGADARSPAMVTIDERPDTWHVEQILEDPDGDHDWRIVATVDLGASDELGAAALRVNAVGPAGVGRGPDKRE